MLKSQEPILVSSQNSLMEIIEVKDQSSVEIVGEKSGKIPSGRYFDPLPPPPNK